MKAFLAVLVSLAVTRAALIDFEAIGGVPGDARLSVALSNGALLNETLAGLQRFDTLLFPNKTFHLMGGIVGRGLHSVTLRFDGTLWFSDDIDAWPTDGTRVLECLQFVNVTNVTFTSSGTGTLYGNGGRWWGIPGIGYAVRGEDRPRLLHLLDSRQLLVENIILKDSPYWTFFAENVDTLEVRHSHVSARRTEEDGHGLIDLSAFNTDGFDVSGRNVWIHDCTVWNQDDCIAVKDGSENMLFERIHASGLGLTIGSIASSVVRNITFRDCYMHRTVKGIYMKFRNMDSPGSITDVVYENIFMFEPVQAAIWIGPAQQADQTDVCHAGPCSLCWPQLLGAKCNLPVLGTYANILLRNVTVQNPVQSPGVVMANVSNPITNITFDDVVFTNPGEKPWGSDYYHCVGAAGRALGKTWPVPPCFSNSTA
ncbi:Endopolygalacturonase I [Diplonema papillatum]|nr:Endopolygalacturonase I [Diplonema papillatum]KAJ9462633.1 Endopolygalacturonase I [Diplonema papillatum]KAJ9462634.1 Endopolygalacturonase I [Diplonema papillatum]